MINEQKNKGLENIREEIDLIDDEIVKLLEERFDKSIEVYEAKLRSNLPIFDDRREERVRQRAGKGKHGVFLERIYEAIMRESKRVQETYWQY